MLESLPASLTFIYSSKYVASMSVAATFETETTTGPSVVTGGGLEVGVTLIVTNYAAI